MNVLLTNLAFAVGIFGLFILLFRKKYKLKWVLIRSYGLYFFACALLYKRETWMYTLISILSVAIIAFFAERYYNKKKLI
jgi:uncharacterized membrane protein (UPF0136 family)